MFRLSAYRIRLFWSRAGRISGNRVRCLTLPLSIRMGTSICCTASDRDFEALRDECPKAEKNSVL